jgi:hypothetical protein
MSSMEYREAMIEIIKVAKPHTYVEIGIWKAQTFNAIAPLVQRAIAVDTNGCGRVNKLPHVETYPLLSDHFFELWKDPIDICFIDADHSYEAAMKDFKNAARFIRPGTGMIFMHDTHPIDAGMVVPTKCGTAHRTAWEIRTSPEFKDFEIATFPWGGAGLSVVRYAPKQLAWEL